MQRRARGTPAAKGTAAAEDVADVAPLPFDKPVVQLGAEIDAMEVDPAGTSVGAATSDRKVSIVDLASGRTTSWSHVGQWPARALAWTRDGTRLAIQTPDDLLVYDRAGKELARRSSDGRLEPCGDAFLIHREGTLTLLDRDLKDIRSTKLAFVDSVACYGDRAYVLDRDTEHERTTLREVTLADGAVVRSTRLPSLDGMIWGFAAGAKYLVTHETNAITVYALDGTRIASVPSRGHDVAMSPDGTRVVVGGRMYSIPDLRRHWRTGGLVRFASQGRIVRGTAAIDILDERARADEYTVDLYRAALAPNGQTLVTSDNGNLLWWSLGKVVDGVGLGPIDAVVEAYEDTVYGPAVVFSTDSTKLYSIGAHSMDVWDATTHARIAHVPIETEDMIPTKIALQGKRVVGQVDDGKGTAFAIDAATYAPLPIKPTWLDDESEPRITDKRAGVVYAPAGEGFREEGGIVIADAKTGQPRARWIGTDGSSIYQLALSPDGTQLASYLANFDSIRIWDTSTFEQIAELPLSAHTSEAPMRFLRDRLLAFDSRGVLHRWQQRDHGWTELPPVTLDGEWMGVGISLDGKRAYAHSFEEQAIAVIDSESGKTLSRILIHAQPDRSNLQTFDPVTSHYTFRASGEFDDVLLFETWDLATGTRVHGPEREKPPVVTCPLPEYEHVLAKDVPGHRELRGNGIVVGLVHILDPATCHSRPLATWSGELTGIFDGDRIYTAGDGDITVWDLWQGAPVARMRVYRAGLWSSTTATRTIEIGRAPMPATPALPSPR